MCEKKVLFSGFHNRLGGDAVTMTEPVIYHHSLNGTACQTGLNLSSTVFFFLKCGKVFSHSSSDRMSHSDFRVAIMRPPEHRRKLEFWNSIINQTFLFFHFSFQVSDQSSGRQYCMKINLDHWMNNNNNNVCKCSRFQVNRSKFIVTLKNRISKIIRI